MEATGKTLFEVNNMNFRINEDGDLEAFIPKPRNEIEEAIKEYAVEFLLMGEILRYKLENPENVVIREQKKKSEA